MTASSLDYETIDSPAPSPPTDVRAVAALVLATVLWGCGFTWAKAAGDAVHAAAGLPQGSMFGPIFILAWRFAIAGLLLVIVVPRARRGWSRDSLVRSLVLGAVLAAGLVVQHLGLDLTSEAVSAFLTSLAVVFVPVIVMVLTRRPPPPVLWIAVGIAVLGVWLLLTGGRGAIGLGWGEALGLACAIAFSVYIVLLNAIAPRDDAWRLTAGQFLVVAIVCAVAALSVPGGAGAWRPERLKDILTTPDVLRNLALLTIFPTLGAFTLLNFFQPRVDPTRAAIIYLLEPVAATIWAGVMTGRLPGAVALAGGALILLANVVTELPAALRRRRVAAPDVTAVSVSGPAFAHDILRGRSS